MAGAGAEGRPHARRRGGGVLGRHPAPRRPGPRRPVWTLGRARRRHSSTSTAAPPTARIWAIGECAAAGRRHVRPGRSRLRDGRGRRRRAAGRRGVVHRRRHVDQAEAARAWTSPASATLSPPPRAAWSWSTPTPSPGVYKKLVVSEDAPAAARRDPGRRRVGVRRAAADGRLGIELPANPEELILPAAARRGLDATAGLPDEAQVCSCNDVTKGDIVAAAARRWRRAPGPGSTCGSCKVQTKKIIEDYFEPRAGQSTGACASTSR